MGKVIKLSEQQLRQIIKGVMGESHAGDIDELDHESFHNDENLQVLRDAIEKNKMVSVAFVKKDGSVKHMLIRRTLSSYVASQREKTDAQMNVEANNDIKKVIDINAYKRELKKLKSENPNVEDIQPLKQAAAKVAWRSINLKNVLGFMVSGQFIDLRDENEIMDRFGEQVHGSITRSMINAMNQEVQPAGDQEINPEQPMDESYWNKLFGSPTIKDAAHDSLRGKGHSHVGKDDSNELYVVFNGQNFYPNQIEYADPNDLGEIPRIEGDKLIVANPAWSL